ncbi:hypothetical protein [Mycobacteroides abscessus]|uniref:hypothetical protein n=1 Tax=Mycobacteroides abscessus TaxID=36809 RepID=UPI0018968E0C
MSAALSDFAFAEPGGKAKGAAYDISVLSDIAPELVGAVTKSVNCLDTSRRVAWAKMYAALERGEQAERDLSRAREDVELLSRLAGFAYGITKALGLEKLYADYLNGDVGQIGEYLQQGAINAGVNSGESAIGRFPEETKVIREYLDFLNKRAQAERSWLEHCASIDDEYQDICESLMKRMERKLCIQYGFKNPTQLRGFIEAHKRKEAAE